MPKWKVTVHVGFVGSCTRDIEVEAETEREAADLASKEAEMAYSSGNEIDDWDSMVTVEEVESI